MPKTPNYILKGGAIIHPIGTSRFYTNPLPDEIAEEYLSNFPLEVNKFAQLPSDWEDRVAAYKARKEQESRAKDAEDASRAVEAAAAGNEIETLQSTLTEANQKIETLSKEKDELTLTVSTLTTEKEELVQQVESLNRLLAEKAEASVGADDSDSEEINNLQMELATAKEELAAAHSEIDQLKTDNRALKAANTRLKNNSAKDAE